MYFANIIPGGEHSMKKLTIYLFIFMLLFQTALAVEENVVEALPTSLPNGPVISKISDNVYTPESISALYGDVYTHSVQDNDTQFPHFVKDELDRFPTVQANWDRGERPKESILNLTENVVLGVYQLKPEDYDGETAFLLIPVTVLSDYQILQIIDAYNQLGIKFDPSMLSFRNCARGGGIEITRLYSDEEHTRRGLLVELIKRQGLKSENPLTPLPNDDGIGTIKLNPDSFNGLESFSFVPFRRLTDDELLSKLELGKTEAYNPEELNSLENISRKEFARLLGMPLATSLEYEDKGIAGKMNIWLDFVEVYSPQFKTPKVNNAHTNYTGHVDVKTGKVLYGSLYHFDANLKMSDLTGDPYDAKWQQIAKDYVEGLRNDGVKVKTVEPRGETLLQDDGNGVTIWLTCEDNSFYEARISYQTEQVSNINYYSEPRDYTRYWEGFK